MSNLYRRRGNSISRILSLPDKGVNSTRGVGGVLSKLFRQILWDLNVSGQIYSSLLTQYVKDPRNGIPDNRRDRASAIGNISKELSKPEMTWKKLVEALRLLQYSEVEITLKGTSRVSRYETAHVVKFSLGEYEEIDKILKAKDDEGQDHE